MGQKTNPIIFQLGKSKKWGNVFEEKKRQEFNKYVENQIELQDFLKKYFKNHGLKICEYNLNYKNNTISIFLSYFVAKTFFDNLRAHKKGLKEKKIKVYELANQKKVIVLRKILKKIYKTFLANYFLKNDQKHRTKNKFFKKNFFKRFVIKKEKLKKETVLQDKFNKSLKKRPWWDKRSTRKDFGKNNHYYGNNHNKKQQGNNGKRLKKAKFFKKKINKKLFSHRHFHFFFKKRISTLFKTFAHSKKHNNLLYTETLQSISLEKEKNSNNILKKNFFTNAFEVIKNYLKNSEVDITFNIKQINLSQNIDKFEFKILKKKLSQLWRFKNQPFYKQGINAIILILKYPHMLDFFIEYIAEEMQKHKRQQFFLNFVKKGLLLFNKSKARPPRNIIIKINGRFNGAPRSKQRVIIVGEKISVISVDTLLYYSEKISISNRGGTFGIKAWISKNSNKNVKGSKKNKV